MNNYIIKKRFLSICLLIALLLFMYTPSFAFEENLEYDEIFIYNGDKYYISYPIETEINVYESYVISGNLQIITTYDIMNNTLKYKYIDFNNNNIIKENNIIISNSSNKRNYISPLVINQKTESTFGYGYYYNTESAYGDYYWRLYCPDASESSNFFFTTAGSPEQTACERFVLDINGMETQALIAQSKIPNDGFSLVVNALELISAFPSVQEILSTLLSITLGSTGSTELNQLYALKADAYAQYNLCL